MRPTAQRLLTLIALLQARRHWPGAELAVRMGVDRRSIRRDIERLRELGYPVRASSGVGGGYQLGSDAPALPLLLEEDEATTIAIALRAAAATVSGIDATAAAVLAKLDPLVPTRHRHEAGQVHAATATLGGLEAPDARLLGRLGRACRQAATLEFDYCSHTGTTTRRRVSAQHLVNYGRRWYLLAWDCQRDDWRTLRVDRMGEVRAGEGGGVHRRLPASPEAMVRHAVSRAPFAQQAVLRLRGSLELLATRVPPWCGTLEADGSEHCLLRMGADSAGMLVGQILGMDEQIEWVQASSPELAMRMRERLAEVDGLLLGPSAVLPG